MKPATLIAAAAMLLVLTACSSTPSLEARTDYYREFDFSGVNRIAIQPVQRANLAAVRISDTLLTIALKTRDQHTDITAHNPPKFIVLLLVNCCHSYPCKSQ